jgi:type I restriction enzyme S subunit
MSFPKYPRYKDSGVEWLGEVPEHWTVIVLKRAYEVTLGKMLQPERRGVDDELLPYLRAANIKWDGVDAMDVKTMWFSPRESADLALLSGDLLVSEGGDVGRSCVYIGDGEAYRFQNSVNRVRPRGSNSTRFLYYWIATIKAKGFVDVLCNKSTIAHFTAEKVAAVPVPLPPNEEQAAIAAFLDRETTTIDLLMITQQHLIELLKEKRQAVISHAVTRGLDPYAPMKPSGVEWLGDVPAHWTVLPIRRVAVRVQTGRTPSSSLPGSDVEDGLVCIPLGTSATLCASARRRGESNELLLELARSSYFHRGACSSSASARLWGRWGSPNIRPPQISK